MEQSLELLRLRINSINNDNYDMNTDTPGSTTKTTSASANYLFIVQSVVPFTVSCVNRSHLPDYKKHEIKMQKQIFVIGSGSDDDAGGCGGGGGWWWWCCCCNCCYY